MFQENGFKPLDFIHMEERSSLLLYICIRTEQSQHQIFGIQTEQNETQNTCKSKYMSEILDNKILRLLNVLMMKTRFPSKVENITITCTLELFNWPSLEVVWCRRIFMTMRCANSDFAAETHRIELHRLWSTHTQDSTTQDPKRAYMYMWRRMFKPLSLYYSLSGLQRIASIFSSSIKPPSLTNWFSLSKIRSLRSFFSFDFKILIIKHRSVST